MGQRHSPSSSLQVPWPAQPGLHFVLNFLTGAGAGLVGAWVGRAGAFVGLGVAGGLVGPGVAAGDGAGTGGGVGLGVTGVGATVGGAAVGMGVFAGVGAATGGLFRRNASSWLYRWLSLSWGRLQLSSTTSSR